MVYHFCSNRINYLCTYKVNQLIILMFTQSRNKRFASKYTYYSYNLLHTLNFRWKFNHYCYYIILNVYFLPYLQLMVLILRT